MKRNTLLLFLPLLLAAAILAGCSTDPGSAVAQDVPVVTAEPYVVVEGRLVPKQSSWLVFSRPGKVTEILVEEGQPVERGQVIARLGERAQLEASLSAAELERLSAQQDLDRLTEKAPLAGSQALNELTAAERDLIAAQETLDEIDTRDFEERLDEAWTNVLDARDDLKDAQEEADKYASLTSDNATRKNAEDDLEAAQKTYDETLRAYNLLKNELDSARYALALAEERYADAERESESRRSGPHPDDLALAQARLDNATAQVASVEAALEDLELTAPYAGIVVELNLTEGEWVPAGQPLVLVADFSAWYVETSDLTEMEVVSIEPGSRVVLTPDALPELSLPGEVEKVADMYTTLRGDITYTARLLLLETDPRLRWGMTMEVSFR